jgi:hypothetical protein
MGVFFRGAMSRRRSEVQRTKRLPCRLGDAYARWSSLYSFSQHHWASGAMSATRRPTGKEMKKAQSA